MNKFFKSAVDRFHKIKERDYLISPISEIDAEIIVEIGQILKKVGLDSVNIILANWKENKDEEVRDDLLQWNIDDSNIKKQTVGQVMTEAVDKLVEEARKPEPTIEIREIITGIYNIVAIESGEDLINDRFWIIINPTPEGTKRVPIFANRKILYCDEESRDSALESIKEALRKDGSEYIKIE